MSLLNVKATIAIAIAMATAQSMQRIGARLAAWRKRFYASQTAAAQAFGVSQSAWSDWEAGKPPSLDLAFALERFTKGAIRARWWARPFVSTVAA